MPVIKCKPTSAGRRHVTKVVNPDLHKGKPFGALVQKKSKSGGRNNNGRITTRHIGGGHKQHYRVVDFKRNKDGIPATVERLEYDPNRTAYIALICFADGERRYILAPKGLKVGDKVVVMPYISDKNSVASRNGKPNCCPNIRVLGVHTDGGMQQQITVPADILLPANNLSDDQMAIDGFKLLCSTEGIIPALEPAHVIGYLPHLIKDFSSNFWDSNFCHNLLFKFLF